MQNDIACTETGLVGWTTLPNEANDCLTTLNNEGNGELRITDDHMMLTLIGLEDELAPAWNQHNSTIFQQSSPHMRVAQSSDGMHIVEAETAYLQTTQSKKNHLAARLCSLMSHGMAALLASFRLHCYYLL